MGRAALCRLRMPPRAQPTFKEQMCACVGESVHVRWHTDTTLGQESTPLGHFADVNEFMWASQILKRWFPLNLNIQAHRNSRRHVTAALAPHRVWGAPVASSVDWGQRAPILVRTLGAGAYPADANADPPKPTSPQRLERSRP